MGSKLIGALLGVFTPFLGPFLGFVTAVSLMEAAMAGVLDSIVFGILFLWLLFHGLAIMWTNHWAE